jgi:hypothetical protein
MAKGLSIDNYFFLIVVTVVIIAASAIFLQSGQPQQQLITVVDFNDSTSNYMRSIFANSQTETVFCAFGRIENETMYITSVQLSEMTNSTGTSVLSQCPSNTLTTIHNHPAKVCKLSSTDIYSFGKTGFKVLGVYCGEYSYAFFNPESLDISTISQVNHRTGSILNALV